VSDVDLASAARGKLVRTLAWSRTPIWPTIVVVVVLAFVPLVWRNDYFISLFVLILLFTIMTQSWKITIGMCGI
jgi:ABC-type branched-subunit amino acid transport system permease subunit